MPVAIDIAKHFKFSPSKLLLPLSYASIMGGTCTLLGTSTNLLVSSMAAERLGTGFGLFELAGVGLVILGAGFVYNILGPMRYLPSRSIISSLTRKYHLSSFLTEVRVPEGSPLIGRTVVEEQVSERFNINVLEILRGRQKIATDLRNNRVREGDVLLVRGPVESLVALRERYGLLSLADIKLTDSDLSDENNILVELQLSPASNLEGRTLREIDFRRRFGSFVLAINRRVGGIVYDKVAYIPLQRWDTLLVFGPRNRVETLQQEEHFLPLQEVGLRLRLSKRWWLSALAIPGVVAMSAAGIPILEAALLAAVFVLVTRRLSIQQAYNSISWTVIFLLAAILPLGTALENTGLAALLGEGIAHLAKPVGPLALLAILLVVTSLLTEMISNNAAAVLMVPVAISCAGVLGVDPKPLLVGVAIAASTAFMTPMGYQTNTMVYGPGAYRFLDYVKAGLPLKVIAIVIAVLAIPRIWPF
jgi:di/tricarboxylate transporter